MLIFLDFDGVLRRPTSPPLTFDSDCLLTFENAVRALPQARIVVTSSWRIVESLAQIRSRFSQDIALRIDGLTGSARYQEDHPRYREVMAYLHVTRQEKERWVAIDDVPSHYPSGTSVILTDPDRGFDDTAAVALVNWK